jgi:predicted 3-demethylubiquinone-9 3-methyltransferase (glyoxalase superfamily)
MEKIAPCLWFDGNAEEAVSFYVSVFPDAKIEGITHYTEETAEASGQPAGSVLTVSFLVNGQHLMALNGGPQFKFSEAISLMVNCDSQQELDMFWAKLSEGGEESYCGWLKDKYGVSWQIVPASLWDMMRDADPATFQRVMAAVLQMRKLDIETLKRAYEGT